MQMHTPPAVVVQKPVPVVVVQKPAPAFKMEKPVPAFEMQQTPGVDMPRYVAPSRADDFEISELMPTEKRDLEGIKAAGGIEKYRQIKKEKLY